MDPAALDQPAPEARIQKVATALELVNFEVFVVDSGEEARSKVFEIIPEGVEVYSAKSKTLEDIGVASEVESGRFDSVRARYMAMDRETQEREIRKLMAAPDYMLGSVSPLTDAGDLITTSYSGSQIGPYAASAGRVILVIGSHCGVTMNDVHQSRCSTRAAAARSARSLGRSFGCPAFLRSTFSWWRRTRISMSLEPASPELATRRASTLTTK